MAQKKIIWTETAAQQRKSILEYWVQRNQSTTYSLKLLRLSNEKANLIANNPLIYNAAEFPDTHVAAMGHFSLFHYRILGQSARPQRTPQTFESTLCWLARLKITFLIVKAIYHNG